MKTLLVGDGYWGNIVKSKLKKLSELVFVATSKHNLDEILSKYEVDLVFICSTTETHYDLVKTCIKHKKRIFCEKSFTGNYLKAVELIEMSKSDIFIDNTFLYRDEYIDIYNENIKNITFLWEKYDVKKSENIYNSLLYHDLYMLIELTNENWIVEKKYVNDDMLRLEMCNGDKKSEFIYNRSVLKKNKKIIIDDIEIDFNKNKDVLFDIIGNFIDNKINVAKNNSVTLKTLLLLEKIKKYK